MPENENECLVEKAFSTMYNKQIGDKIILDVEKQSNDDGEDIEYLKQNEVTIVGIAQSPLYISKDRGTTILGAGKIDDYIYIPKENINAKDVYTNIYVKVENADKYITSDKEYEDYIQETLNNIEDIKEKRERARHDTLVRNSRAKGK